MDERNEAGLPKPTEESSSHAAEPHKGQGERVERDASTEPSAVEPVNEGDVQDGMAYPADLEVFGAPDAPEGPATDSVPSPYAGGGDRVASAPGDAPAGPAAVPVDGAVVSGVPAVSAPAPAAPTAPAASAAESAENPWNGPTPTANDAGYWDAAYEGERPHAPRRSGAGAAVVIAVIAAAVVLVAAFVFLPRVLSSRAGWSGGVPAEMTSFSEEGARSAASAALDTLVNADEGQLELIGDLVDEGFENQMDFPLAMCGVNATDYARTMLEGFSYEIDEVHLDSSEETAYVTATVEVRDVFSMIDMFNELLATYTSSEEYQTSTVAEDLERIGYIFMEAARTAEMNDDYPFALELSYEDGVWEVDEDAWEAELDYLFDVE